MSDKSQGTLTDVCSMWRKHISSPWSWKSRVLEIDLLIYRHFSSLILCDSKWWRINRIKGKFHLFKLFFPPCESEVSQLCPVEPMDCSPPGSSVYGIFQARVLEWVAISFSRGSSQPRDRTRVSRTAGRRFTVWAISIIYSEAPSHLLTVTFLQNKNKQTN